MIEATAGAAGAMRLLLVNAGPSLAAGLKPSLEAEFDECPIVVELACGRLALDVLRSSPFDAIAADLAALGDLGARSDEQIGRLARAAAGALVLILTEDGSISSSLAAMRAGAHGCAARLADGATIVTQIGELARRLGKSRVLTRSQPAEATNTVAGPAEPEIPPMHNLVLPMWRQEQRIIESAIESFAGNIALAAAALELSPSTIYRKRAAWAGAGPESGAEPA